MMPLNDGNGVRAALTVCGCTNEQRNALVEEGLTTMADLLVIQAKDVAAMCNNLSRIPANRGGCKIGTVIMKKLEALINWCHDRNREGHDLDANEFNADVLSEYVMKAQLDDAGDVTNPEPPKDFKVLLLGQEMGDLPLASGRKEQSPSHLRR